MNLDTHFKPNPTYLILVDPKAIHLSVGQLLFTHNCLLYNVDKVIQGWILMGSDFATHIKLVLRNWLLQTLDKKMKKKSYSSGRYCSPST